MTPLRKPKDDSVLHVRQNLLSYGYKIIPCRGKIPHGFAGWQHCRATYDNILSWETSHPDNRNTGVLTGEVVAIDVDILRPDLAAAVITMVRELPGGELAPMRVGKAPKALFFFRTETPRDKMVSSWFKIDGVDQRIEVMGCGQQVIVDGIHPETGKPYVWTPLYPPALELPLIDWPSLERLMSDVELLLEPHGAKTPPPKKREAANDNSGDNFFRRANQAALNDLAAWVPSLELPKTKRLGEGYRAVCAWRGVKNANLSFHPEGITDWGSGETHTAIDVIVKAGKADGTASAADWLCGKLGRDKTDLGWIDREEPMMPPPGLDELLRKHKAKMVPIEKPFTPQAAGGLMGEIADWILRTSRRRTPEFAVMAALGFVSVFYGRRVIGPTSAGVNLYLAGIAGPGYGKEAPQARILQLLEDAKLPYLIGPGEVTSATAIEKELRNKPVMLMVWDEFGEVMQSVNSGGSGNWTATIRKLMLETFSKATSVWRGKEHASKDTVAEPIFCPSLSIMGMSTPTTFYGGLSESNLTDGFVARIIFVSPKARPVRSNPKDDGLQTPADILEAVRHAGDVFPWPDKVNSKGGWRTPGMKPVLFKVPWKDDAAEKAWLNVEDWQECEIQKDELRDGVMGRCAEHVVKLATLRALSRNPANPSVSTDDIAWGEAIAKSSIDAVESGIDQHMSGSQFEAVCKAIIKALRAGGGDMHRATILRRKGVSKADDRMFDGAIRRLQESGDIEKTDGRKLTLTDIGWGR